MVIVYLTVNCGVLHAQSLPEWGQWWQQPIAREYGGTERNPNQPLGADEQVQQDGVENLLQSRSLDMRYENQRELNDAIQQKRVTEKLQQRTTDELIQQGNVEEVLRQKNIDDLIQQRRYDPLYEGP
jgi:ParB-like chromosome segregation protein Spo0J